MIKVRCCGAMELHEAVVASMEEAWTYAQALGFEPSDEGQRVFFTPTEAPLSETATPGSPQDFWGHHMLGDDPRVVANLSLADTINPRGNTALRAVVQSRQED